MNCKKLNCKAIALKTDSYCYMHSKKIKESDKHKARSNGGKHKTIKIDPNEFQTFELETIKDVMKINAELINRVLNGKYNIKAGTSICYMLALQLKAIELNNSAKNSMFTMSDVIIKLPPDFEDSKKIE